VRVTGDADRALWDHRGKELAFICPPHCLGQGDRHCSPGGGFTSIPLPGKPVSRRFGPRKATPVGRGHTLLHFDLLLIGFGFTLPHCI
jgi:hypothetical protein